MCGQMRCVARAYNRTAGKPGHRCLQKGVGHLGRKGPGRSPAAAQGAAAARYPRLVTSPGYSLLQPGTELGLGSKLPQGSSCSPTLASIIPMTMAPATQRGPPHLLYSLFLFMTVKGKSCLTSFLTPPPHFPLQGNGVSSFPNWLVCGAQTWAGPFSSHMRCLPVATWPGAGAVRVIQIADGGHFQMVPIQGYPSGASECSSSRLTRPVLHVSVFPNSA